MPCDTSVVIVLVNKVDHVAIKPLKGFYLSDTKRLAWINVLKENKIKNDSSYKAFLDGRDCLCC